MSYDDYCLETTTRQLSAELGLNSVQVPQPRGRLTSLVTPSDTVRFHYYKHGEPLPPPPFVYVAQQVVTGEPYLQPMVPVQNSSYFDMASFEGQRSGPNFSNHRSSQVSPHYNYWWDVVTDPSCLPVSVFRNPYHASPQNPIQVLREINPNRRPTGPALDVWFPSYFADGGVHHASIILSGRYKLVSVTSSSTIHPSDEYPGRIPAMPIYLPSPVHRGASIDPAVAFPPTPPAPQTSPSKKAKIASPRKKVSTPKKPPTPTPHPHESHVPAVLHCPFPDCLLTTRSVDAMRRHIATKKHAEDRRRRN
ncbi:hypothetical protein BDP27DRAFT_1429029 [Rhodocollybia butyracea]|uniref:Uncharacterized protein n=1 Tax=Rhodocollybia butyracea TaxID=206335 RepID=A0A9P5PDK4_9AGAR|nr:hypothetical protein BDP27DRAFT_1429029 [Rhodocollybia butyracea]